MNNQRFTVTVTTTEGETRTTIELTLHELTAFLRDNVAPAWETQNFTDMVVNVVR